MTAYQHLKDVLPCPMALEHDWLDRRQHSSDEPYKAECSWCAALLDKRWWGWDFRTGLEHFEDAKYEPLPPGLARLVRADEQGAGLVYWGPNLLLNNGRGQVNRNV